MKRGKTQHTPSTPEQEHALKNLLVVVLVLIIFVSLVGTVFVKNAIDDLREQARDRVPSLAALTGKITVSILSPTADEEKNGGQNDNNRK